jgi:hypothetical protein
MNCIVSVWLGSCGGSALYRWLRMHNMSGLSLALHWHFVFGCYKYMGAGMS